MNAPVRAVYTNEVSQEYLDNLIPIAIFLFATEGSQTRNGGVVHDGTATSNYHAS